MKRNPTLLFFLLALLFSCTAGGRAPGGGAAAQQEAVTMAAGRPGAIPVSIAVGETVSGPGKMIDAIYQDRDFNYWFATNGEGVYRYDGKTTLHITEKDGLCSDFVWSVQEDANGVLWFGSRDGICSFDGMKFTDHIDRVRKAPYGTLNYTPGGLFFNHPGGVCFYDGKTFTNFTLHPETYVPPANSMERPYDVYSTLADRSGKIWFGTQEMGVCVYDGKRFSYIGGKDLDGPAVRSVFQDRDGTMWFGNNGGGLYRYDGQQLRNITEEKNLGNAEFLRGRKPVDKPGSLARVFAISQDREGNLWIGTADAGVWRYDGTGLTNYTTREGLSGNSVTVIYKDRKGDLFFVSNGDAVLRFNGSTFSKVAFQAHPFPDRVR